MCRKFCILVLAGVLLSWVACNDKEPPIVEITIPQDGARVDSIILVVAEAVDNELVDSVEIFIDDSFVAGDARPYCIYEWNTDSLPHNSLHDIYAIAYDEAHNIGTSDVISVTVQHPGTLKWSFENINSGLSMPVIGTDGTIYLGARPYFYALNPDGTVKWQYYVGYDYINAPAMAEDGTIYFGTYYGDFYALNPDGTLKWHHYEFCCQFSSPAIASDGTVYVGLSDTVMFAFNPDGTIKWTFPTHGTINSSPAIAADGTVYFGSYDDNFYAVNPDGTLKWSYPDVPSNTSPAIGADGTIYFYASGHYYALNPDGTLKWRFHTDYYAYSAAVGVDGTIYFGCYYYLYALTPEGGLKWRTYIGTNYLVSTNTPALDTDGTIYVGSFNGYFYAINPDGSVKWFYIAFRTDCNPTIAEDGTIYVSGLDRLYALNGSAPLADSPWPKFHRDPRNTGRVGSGF